MTELPSTDLRKARCETHPSAGEHASLWYFSRHAGGLLRVTWNAIWIYAARFAPTFGLKRLFYRMVGAKVA
ncbi:MAG TPA: hypothetical protein PL074_09720, partial [Thermoflexales bacterium]|nr:hypothetical protein [Thermoflexales bacterium]